MARHETDREDLMQGSDRLGSRVEWQVPFVADPVVAGFKKNGAWSVYFGAERCFNSIRLAGCDARSMRAFSSELKAARWLTTAAEPHFGGNSACAARPR